MGTSCRKSPIHLSTALGAIAGSRGKPVTPPGVYKASNQVESGVDFLHCAKSWDAASALRLGSAPRKCPSRWVTAHARGGLLFSRGSETGRTSYRLEDLYSQSELPGPRARLVKTSELRQTSPFIIATAFSLLILAPGPNTETSRDL